MTSTFESKCVFTLLSCLVSWLGLFLMQDQCSGFGMAITLVGIVGIGWGIRGVVCAVAPLLAAKRVLHSGMPETT